MNWESWLKGLISAGIGAAANTVTVMIVDPLEFNFTTGLTKLGTVCLVSAIVAMAMYLKSSPLPCEPPVQAVIDQRKDMVVTQQAGIDKDQAMVNKETK
jgi:hypothetical protein